MNDRGHLRCFRRDATTKGSDRHIYVKHLCTILTRFWHRYVVLTGVCRKVLAQMIRSLGEACTRPCTLLDVSLFRQNALLLPVKATDCPGLRSTIWNVMLNITRASRTSSRNRRYGSRCRAVVNTMRFHIELWQVDLNFRPEPSFLSWISNEYNITRILGSAAEETQPPGR